MSSMKSVDRERILQKKKKNTAFATIQEDESHGEGWLVWQPVRSEELFSSKKDKTLFSFVEVSRY